MRCWRDILTVTCAALCLVVLLASMAWAQDAGKGGDAKGGDANASKPIDWKPDTKLDWKDFKGGKPKDDSLDAETAGSLSSPWTCSKDGKYSFKVKAQFEPDKSTTKGPEAQTKELLAHEQIHFDLLQKQAIALEKTLKDIFEKNCKCPMDAAKLKAMGELVDAATKAAVDAWNEEGKRYDDETNHGTKAEEQQKWAKDTAKALGQPEPQAPPPADNTPKAPQAEKKCADCEKLEAQRKKTLAELEAKVDPLRKKSKALFGQIDAFETQISAANADIQAAQKDLAGPKKKQAQDRIDADNRKIKTAQEKEGPLKTEKGDIDKRIEELEKQIAPLQEPTKCPKCTGASGNSSYIPSIGDGFANALPSGPITGGGNACPPPRETYVPGTPSSYSKQYVSENPGNATPGEFISYSVPFASDSGAYCTFGEGTSVPGDAFATDDGGNLIPASSTGDSAQGDKPAGPGTMMTPKPTDTPTPQMTEPPRTASTPTPTPSPSETPKAASTPSPTPTPTDTPIMTASDTPVPQTTDTPQQPTDTPTPQIPTDTPPVQITIFIKATEEVLTGGPTGDSLQGQVVKLVMRGKPDLPTTANDRTTADKGFDKPAPQCTTGADGQCKIDVPAEDRPLYALDKTPRVGGKPVTKYSLAVNAMKHTGGVAEVTGKQVPDVKDRLTNGNMTAEFVKIGSRTFVRLGFNTPKGVTEDLAATFSKLLGVPVEIDICLIKEPGPPLGSEPLSYRAINQELPNAEIKLQPSAKRAAR